MEYDVYDPSNTVAGGYWQVGHARDATDRAHWQTVADLVNQGVPTREDALFRGTEPERENEIWGGIRMGTVLWTYRVFLTGRDSFARPGRYFFLVLKVPTSAALADPLVGRVLRCLEAQTGIPLDVSRLPASPCGDNEAVGGLTARILGRRSDAQVIPASVMERLMELPEGVHRAWVVHTESGAIREHGDLPGTGKHIARPDSFLPRVPSGAEAPAAKPMEPAEVVRPVIAPVRTDHQDGLDGNPPGTPVTGRENAGLCSAAFPAPALRSLHIPKVVVLLLAAVLLISAVLLVVLLGRLTTIGGEVRDLEARLRLLGESQGSVQRLFQEVSELRSRIDEIRRELDATNGSARSDSPGKTQNPRGALPSSSDEREQR